MDIATVGDIAGIIGSGIGATEQADSLFERIRKRFEKEDPVDRETAQLFTELSRHILDAQKAQMQALRRVNELEVALQDAQRREELRSLYRPVTLPGGGQILRLSDPSAAERHFYQICPACFQNRQKEMPLQPYGHLLKCTGCDKTFVANEAPDLLDQPRSSRGIWDDYP